MRTVTAMFDSRDEAHAAYDRLKHSGIAADRVRIVDRDAIGGETGSAVVENHESFWAALVDTFMPEDERQAYGEHVRRGGFLLCALVGDTDAQRAERILDEAGSVDLALRRREWQADGWSGVIANGQAGAFGRISNDDKYASGRE